MHQVFTLLVEGGSSLQKSGELTKKLALWKFRSLGAPMSLIGTGINGKNSEFHAAMGLSVLPHYEILAKSKHNRKLYKQF